MQEILLSDNIKEDLKKRKIALTQEQPINGDIFIRKPWVANYPTTPIKIINTKNTLYQTYKTSCSEILDEIALIIPDTEEAYTHRELLELVDKTASALADKNIKEGSIIGALLNNTIEEPVMMLAASKLGATIKFIDYTKSTPAIKQAAEELPLDLLVIDEMVMPIEPVINSGKKPAIVCGTHRIYNRGNYLSFRELLKYSKDLPVEAIEYKENRPAVIINSSGTTGTAKPIVHSDKSINEAVQKMLFSNYPIDDKHMLMKIIPPQIGLGVITSLYTGLISGTKISLIRGANAEDSIGNTLFYLKAYPKILQKYNISQDTKVVIFASPMYFRIIITNPLIDDLSYVDGMLAAGSKMTKDELEELMAIAQTKGCSIPITNGYGQNELGGAVTLNDPKYNKNGSAGYPVIGTDIRIVNQITLETVKPFEEGKILEKSDSEFLEYANLAEKTEEARITLPDGTNWFDTKDLGYIDEEGFLFITGRESRVIIRSDFKIPLDAIEAKIKQIPFVKECAVLVSSHDTSFEELEAYIVLKDEYINQLDENEVANEIYTSGVLIDVEFPNSLQLIEDMPYLSSGKIDYQTLLKKSKLRKKELTTK